jgi:hypothetical protein
MLFPISSRNFDLAPKPFSRFHEVIRSCHEKNQDEYLLRCGTNVVGDDAPVLTIAPPVRISQPANRNPFGFQPGSIMYGKNEESCLLMTSLIQQILRHIPVYVDTDKKVSNVALSRISAKNHDWSAETTSSFRYQRTLLMKALQIHRGATTEFNWSENSTSIFGLGSLSASVGENISMHTLTKIYNNMKLGGHVSYLDGTRAGVMRGTIVLALHYAYSLPVTSGGRNLKIWAFRWSKYDKGKISSLAPVHPQDATSTDLNEWSTFQSSFRAGAEGMCRHLRKVGTLLTDTNVLPTNVTDLVLKHSINCGYKGCISTSAIQSHIESCEKKILHDDEWH